LHITAGSYGELSSDVLDFSLAKCTVIEKSSNESKSCQFPFMYKNQLFHGCTTLLYKIGDTTSWCSTKRDPETLEHVAGHENFGNCPSDCPTSEEAQARFDEKVEQANILGNRGYDPTTTKGRLKWHHRMLNTWIGYFI
jgi:hypothetical protein